jgi:hypothetical protein
VGQGGEMTQALYTHMNNKTIKKRLVAQFIYISAFIKCPSVNNMEKGKEYFLMFLPECSRLSNNMNFDMI